MGGIGIGGRMRWRDGRREGGRRGVLVTPLAELGERVGADEGEDMLQDGVEEGGGGLWSLREELGSDALLLVALAVELLDAALLDEDVVEMEALLEAALGPGDGAEGEGAEVKVQVLLRVGHGEEVAEGHGDRFV